MPQTRTRAPQSVSVRFFFFFLAHFVVSLRLILFPRIAVRIRPPLEPSDPGYDLIPQRFQRSMVQTSSDTNLSIDSPQGRKLFVFDRVFGPEVEQEGIWDYLAESVNSFAQGYNVSLLAYGQSGAGKSYTMGTSGPLDQQDDRMMGKPMSPVAALSTPRTLPPTSH